MPDCSQTLCLRRYLYFQRFSVCNSQNNHLKNYNKPYVNGMQALRDLLLSLLQSQVPLQNKPKVLLSLSVKKKDVSALVREKVQLHSTDISFDPYYLTFQYELIEESNMHKKST